MADSVPKYDMARTCRLDHAAASGLAVSESMKSCVRDEKRALGQLQKQWSKFPAQKRAGCVSQNTIGGTPSYVGLLTCLQSERFRPGFQRSSARRGRSPRRTGDGC
jgi:hypothetical protein